MRLWVLVGFALWSTHVYGQPVTGAATPETRPSASATRVSAHGWVLGALGAAVGIGGGIALGLGLYAQPRALNDEERSSATSNITGGALLLGTAVCLFALAVVAWLWRDVPAAENTSQ